MTRLTSPPVEFGGISVPPVPVFFSNGKIYAAMPAAGRVLRRVRLVGSCWVFQGTLDRSGYGKVKASAHERGVVSAGAHRVVYEWVHGRVSVDLQIDHLCRNKACVNPSHMEPVTAAENTLRAARVRTTCRKGHSYSPANTRVRGNRRICRTCVRGNSAAYKARRLAELSGVAS